MTDSLQPSSLPIVSPDLHAPNNPKKLEVWWCNGLALLLGGAAINQSIGAKRAILTWDETTNIVSLTRVDDTENKVSEVFSVDASQITHYEAQFNYYHIKVGGKTYTLNPRSEELDTMYARGLNAKQPVITVATILAKSRGIDSLYTMVEKSGGKAIKTHVARGVIIGFIIGVIAIIGFIIFLFSGS